jgi:hypothetical protein
MRFKPQPSVSHALTTPCQLAQARLRALKKKKSEDDAKAKAEQQVGSSSSSSSSSVTRGLSGNFEEVGEVG